MNDKEYLQVAIDQAKKSINQGGFPAGAVIVKNGEIVSRGISIGSALNDPTSHAETASMREACKVLKTDNLEGATLYGNLELCVMCFSVANWVGISRIVFATKKTKDMVEKGYYEGVTDIRDINKENRTHLDIVFVPELEEESLQVVKEWEDKNFA